MVLAGRLKVLGQGVHICAMPLYTKTTSHSRNNIGIMLGVFKKNNCWNVRKVLPFAPLLHQSYLIETFKDSWAGSSLRLKVKSLAFSSLKYIFIELHWYSPWYPHLDKRQLRYIISYHIYVYIYIERERKRERKKEQ